MNDHDSTDARLRAALRARLDDAPATPSGMDVRTLAALSSAEPRPARAWRDATAWWLALAAPARWALAAVIVVAGGSVSIGSFKLVHRLEGTARPYVVTYDRAPVARVAAQPAHRPQQGSQIARSGEIDVVVRDVGNALRAIRRATARESGSVSALHDTIPDDPAQPRSAQLTLTVPASRLDGVMDAVAATGAVKSRSTHGEDIATPIVDAGARLRNLRRTERDLQKIMDRGGSTADVLDVQTHLTDVRGEIETLDAQLASMQRRVATATLDVTLAQDRAQHAAAIPSAGARLDTIWHAALRHVRKRAV